jgi:hypothetical protein
VLKVTAKIFDPIGILTPFTIGMKILFQELCVQKHEWDGELQSNLLKAWKLPPPQASLGLLIQRERERKVDEKPKQMEKRRENK